MTTPTTTFISREVLKFRNITYSNRPDRAAQLAEHWASIPKVVGSITGMVRHIFRPACIKTSWKDRKEQGSFTNDNTETC